MRTLILFILSFLPISLLAQKYEYSELIQIAEEPISVLKNDSTSLLKDDTGASFTEILSALEFLEKNNWEFILSYAKCAKKKHTGNTVINIDQCDCCQEIENHLVFRSKKPVVKP